jgi:hypothetical protein
VGSPPSLPYSLLRRPLDVSANGNQAPPFPPVAQREGSNLMGSFLFEGSIWTDVQTCRSIAAPRFSISISITENLAILDPVFDRKFCSDRSIVEIDRIDREFFFSF